MKRDTTVEKSDKVFDPKDNRRPKDRDGGREPTGRMWTSPERRKEGKFQRTTSDFVKRKWCRLYKVLETETRMKGNTNYYTYERRVWESQ